jgi:hypothetical protein
MAKNENFERAERQSWPVPSGKVSGDPVRVGGVNGVCLTDRALTSVPVDDPTYNYGGGNLDGYASVATVGEFTFTTSFAIAAVGDPVYILANGSDLTGTAGGNNLFGYARSTKGASAGPLRVRIAN